MSQSIEFSEFYHKAPYGYSYEFEEFKKNVISVWICNHYKFVYNGGSPTRSIWGFYNVKTKEYQAPINSKTVGKNVRIQETTPYSAMIPKHNPLMAAFF